MKNKKNRRVVFPDIGNFYIDKEEFQGGNEWYVYSDKGDYVGFIYTGKGAGVTYPENVGDSATDWEVASLSNAGGNLKNAVRFLYLNWAKISQRETQTIREATRMALKESYELNEGWGRDIPGPDPFSPAALGTVYLPETKKIKKQEEAEGVIQVPGIKGLSMWPIELPSKRLIWFVDEPNKWTIGKIDSDGVFLYADPTKSGGKIIKLDINSEDKIQAAKLIYLKHLELRGGKEMPKTHVIKRSGNISEGRLEKKTIKGKKVHVIKPLSPDRKRDIGQISKGRITFDNNSDLYAIRNYENINTISWWVYNEKERIAIINAETEHISNDFLSWIIYVRDKVGQSWDKISLDEKNIRKAVSLAYLTWAEKYGTKKGALSETKSISKWPDDVHYPHIGDVMAIRRSDDAKWWTFIGSDGKHIGTYMVNPDNLAKELKNKAEKAYNKWLDVYAKSVNESHTKRQTVVISDEERKRIFDNNAQSIATIQMTEFFINMLDGCEIVVDKRYPNSVFYRKNGEVLFEKDVKNKYFFVHYDKIWLVLERRFGLQYGKMQTFIKNVLETLKNFQGLRPLQSNTWHQQPIRWKNLKI